VRPEHSYTQFEDRPAFDEVEPLADRYIRGFIERRLDRIEVACMKFFNASVQKAVVETLLPLAPAPEPAERPGARTGLQLDAAARGPRAGRPAHHVEYEFLPGAADILQELLPVSFKVRLFKCFLDAAVSEQIARRVTMKQATENADEMIKTLTRQYNRARQAQITKEIAEVIGGAEALK
jgi:F-type H+-transporting ATPase subunit gamma